MKQFKNAEIILDILVNPKMFNWTEMYFALFLPTLVMFSCNLEV